jgi:hypothetical protein
MKKIFLFAVPLVLTSFLCVKNVEAQVVYEKNYLKNEYGLIVPFEKSNGWLNECTLFFRKTEGSPYVELHYRIFLDKPIHELHMREKPELLVKLGDGTVMRGMESRIGTGVLNASYVIYVYFNLDQKLQNKISKYGIEKLRFAFVYNYLGMNEDQIYDAYIKDSPMNDKDFSIQSLLNDIQNANLTKAKEEAHKNGLFGDF